MTRKRPHDRVVGRWRVGEGGAGLPWLPPMSLARLYTPLSVFPPAPPRTSRLCIFSHLCVCVFVLPASLSLQHEVDSSRCGSVPGCGRGVLAAS